MDKLKIGILGAGGISSRVAAGITQSYNCVLAFVGSTDRQRAKNLAEKFGVSEYGNYEELLNADIDAVYIATINRLHYHHIKLCLANNKHVICEKPLLSNNRELTELYKLAQERDLLLLEAMKCRYLPTVNKVKELLAAYGKPLEVTATFCRQEGALSDLHHAFYDPLYGGALKDVGCYVISWVLEVFPAKLVDCQLQQRFRQEVDVESWLELRNSDGIKFSLGCAVDYDKDNQAVIQGKDYQIIVRNFWKSYDIEVWRDGKLTESYRKDLGSEFAYEVQYFAEVIEKADQQAVDRAECDFLKRVIDLYPTSK